MRLTDVARASLSELRGDYEIWILDKGELLGLHHLSRVQRNPPRLTRQHFHSCQSGPKKPRTPFPTAFEHYVNPRQPGRALDPSFMPTSPQ